MNNDILLSNIKESIYNQASKISFPFNNEETSNLLYYDLIIKTLQDIGVYNPETDKVNIKDCWNGKFDITVTKTLQEVFEFELTIGGK
jgi:hypothetical protein